MMQWGWVLSCFGLGTNRDIEKRFQACLIEECQLTIVYPNTLYTIFYRFIYIKRQRSLKYKTEILVMFTEYHE